MASEEPLWVTLASSSYAHGLGAREGGTVGLGQRAPWQVDTPAALETNVL